MADINNILLAAFYQKLQPIAETFQGEEPDNLENDLYIVIGDVNSTDASTQTTLDNRATVQVTVNAKGVKSISTLGLNNTTGQILSAIFPTPIWNLPITGVQITNLKLTSDRTERYGTLGADYFISRILIFEATIYQNLN